MKINKLFGMLTLVLLISFVSVSAVVDWDNDVYSFTPFFITDGESTGLIDLSGNGYNATAYGGVTFTNASKTSFDFDGVDDEVVIFSQEFSDIWSLSAFVRTDFTGYQTIIGRRDSSADRHFRFVLNANSHLTLYLYNGGSSACGSTTEGIDTLDDGLLHHVVATSSGSDITLYVDGSQVAQTTDHGSCNPLSDTQNTIIGQEGDSVVPFDGEISDVKILEVELTSTEVSDLYDQGMNYNPYTSGSSPKFEITSKNVYDDSSINSFWALIDGTNYTTTNGTITTNLYQNDTGTYSLQVGSSDYFTETYSSIDVSSNYEAVLHQSEISFNSFEYISNNTLSNCNYTIDSQLNTTFYLNVGTHTVLAECLDYYAKNYTFNVTALQIETLNITDVYNVVMNVDLNDLITTDLIETTSYVTVNNNEGFVQTYDAVNGSLSINLIQDNYSLILWADNYAFKYVNVTLNNLTESFSYSLYSNNSIWITALDQNTGSTLLNFSVEIFDANISYTATDNNTGIIRLNNVTSGVYTARIDKDLYSSAEYALTMTGGSHQALVAYLVTSGSETIFTVVDAISSQILEGVSVSMFKTINSSWTLVSSQESDITGRVQFTYIPNVEYKFIIDADGYELRNFFLKPLFTSYTIRLTPDVETIPDQNTGSYIYSINNSGLFYNNLNNSFEISILSGTGTLEYYNLTVTNFNGTPSLVNCSVANGCSDLFNFEITSADFADVVVVEYWIKESGRSEKYFKIVYHIQDIYQEGTLEGWKDVDDSDVDSLSKAFIAMIICLIVVGFVSVGSIMVGIPPVTASGVILALLVEVFAYVGFIPNLAGHLVALGCILILIFGRGEI